MSAQVIVRRDNFGFEDESGLERDKVELFGQRRPRFDPRFARQFASSAGAAAGKGGGLSSSAIIGILVSVFVAAAGLAALSISLVI